MERKLNTSFSMNTSNNYSFTKLQQNNETGNATRHHHHDVISQSRYSSTTDTDDLLGFTWPPRSYTCSFCKREFRSAQALGGHMNVHRRDRARVRSSQQHSPPPHDQNPNSFLNLNLNQNPNPNYNNNLSSFSPSDHQYYHFTSSSAVAGSPLSSLSTATASPSDKGSDYLAKMMTMKTAKSSFDYDMEDEFLKRKNEIVRLDLEIGLVNGDESKDDLDLELRLGYSN